MTVVSLEPDPGRQPSLAGNAAVDADRAGVRTAVLIVTDDDARAGGPGRRLGIPALMPVANRPLLAHVAASLRGLGAERTLIVAPPSLVAPIGAVVTGAPGCDGVETLGCAAITRPDGFADVLRAVHAAVGDEPMLMQAAGGLLQQTRESLSDLVTDEPRVVLLTSRRPGPRATARLDDRRLLKLVGEPVRDTDMRPTGAAVLGRGSLTRALSLVPDGAQATAAELLELLGAAGVPVEARPATGWHPYTGQITDLLDVNRRILDDLEDNRDGIEYPGSHLHGRIWVHPTAVIESAVIRGPVIIGEGARIVDAYVGPYTAIGQGVQVEGAEVEHSILLEGARVMHVGRRLEASVIGRDAHVFRDFALPRALRLHVGDGAEVALC